MNFLREKQTCRYFLFLQGTGLLLMLAALGCASCTPPRCSRSCWNGSAL